LIEQQAIIIGGGNMKSVLLLGDSIRMGYCPYVKEELKEEAEVYYPEENCRYTQYTLVSLSNWLNIVPDPKEVRVVHWNNGHWDIAHWRGEAVSLNSPEQYAQMLERIYRQLCDCCPNAAIIFALTTPMNPDGSAGLNPRTNSEIEKYNAVACDVMGKLGVTVNDLYALMKDKSSSWYKDYAHFTEDGYRLLAKNTSRVIRGNFKIASGELIS
jgi:lysophospholipase L1-like esterase